MILLILALIWAAALLPPLIRSRLEGNPVDSVGRFRRHLRVIESTGPAASALARHPGSTSGMPAAWANEARRLRLLRRRQQVAAILLAVMASTLLVGLLPSMRPVLILHVLADAGFVAYITMLAKARAAELEQRRRSFTATPAMEEEAQSVGPHTATVGQQAY